jgi:transposase
MIEEKEIHGEKGTGYAGPEDGPFRCSNCKYFNRQTDGCSNKAMKKLSKRPRLPSGDVQVDPNGCCIYEYAR